MIDEWKIGSDSSNPPFDGLRSCDTFCSSSSTSSSSNSSSSSSSSSSSGCPIDVKVWGLHTVYVDGVGSFTGNDWLVKSPSNNYTKVLGTKDFSFGLTTSGSIEKWGLSNDMDYGVMGKDIPIPLTQPNSCIDFDIGRFNGVAVLKGSQLVTVWGNNDYGQLNVPLNVGPCLQVATGNTWGGGHILALRTDSTIVAWGRNDFKQCVVPQFSQYETIPFTQIAASSFGSIGLRANGTVVVWGHEPNYTNSYPRVVKFQPETNGFYTSIAAGGNHFLGLLSDGRVMGWGLNTSGQCNVPTLPAGLTYTKIAAGTNHSIALRSDGSVIAWGHNSFFCCGGSTTAGTYPDSGFYISGGVETVYNNNLNTSYIYANKTKYWKKNSTAGKYSVIGAGERHSIALYQPNSCNSSSSSSSSSSSASIVKSTCLKASRPTNLVITSDMILCGVDPKNTTIQIPLLPAAAPDFSKPYAVKVTTAGIDSAHITCADIFCRLSLSGCNCTRQPKFSIVRRVSGVDTEISISETGYFQITDYDLGKLYLKTVDLDNPGLVGSIDQSDAGAAAANAAQFNDLHNYTGPWFQDFSTISQGQDLAVNNTLDIANNSGANGSPVPKLGIYFSASNCSNGNDNCKTCSQPTQYETGKWSSEGYQVPVWTAVIHYLERPNRKYGTTIKTSDTLSEWLNISNEQINNANHQVDNQQANLTGYNGDITTTIISDSEVQTSINISQNGGIISTPNGLRISLTDLPSDTISENDYISFEKYYSNDFVTPIKRISASEMLPVNIKGNHIFKNTEINSFVEFNFDNVTLDTVKFSVTSPYIHLNEKREILPKRIDIFGGIVLNSQSEVVKFEYIGYNDSWISSGNIGVKGKSFVNTQQPEFTIGLLHSQTNPSIKIQTDTQDSNKFFKIQLYSDENIVSFGFNGDYAPVTTENDIYETNTDGDYVLDTDGDRILLYHPPSDYINKQIFTGRINPGDESTEFRVTDKFFIGNIAGSTQFSNKPKTSYDQNYTEGIIPFTNSNGILDSRWSNRYVSSYYDSNISVGDIVRISSDSRNLDDIFFNRLVKADCDTESNSNYIGIVEKISNNQCYVVINGEFILENLDDMIVDTGRTYYLSNSNTDGNTLTETKPETIVKMVVIGTSYNTGILLNSSLSQNALFNNISVTNSLINEHFIFTPEISNDTLSFRGGAGITLTHTTDDAILISASGGAGTQNTFSRVNSVSARGTTDNIQITGLNGLEVQVSGTAGIDTEVELSIPNSFGVVQIVANSTDDHEFTINSVESNDNLQVFAGTGISITPHSTNGLVITATGTSVPAVDSVTNSILAQMPAYAIKASDSSGNPIDVQFQSIPAFSIDGSYNFYINSVLVPGPGPGGDGVPSAIAGYVVGRITDETGTTSNIKSLNRSDLRMLLGIADTGWIQPLEPTFKYIEISADNTDGTTLIQANSNDDILSFVAGNGIIISGLDGSTNNQNEIKISVDLAHYIAPLVKGFNKIKLDNNSYYTSVTSNSILEFNETQTISPSFGTTDNATVSFNVKSNSIANNHLTKMNAYTVKANNHSTVENPSDVLIGENTLLGRLADGNITGLSATSIKAILGLTSSNYFKQISITDGTTTTINSTSVLETIKFVAGTNVTLTKDNNNNIIISAGAAASNGLKSIQTVSESSSKIATKLIFDSIKIADSFNSQLYTNISVYPSFNTNGDYTAKFDLSPMPANSVKVASSVAVTNASGFSAKNLILNPNTVLGRKVTGEVVGLTVTDLRSLVNINSISTVNITNVINDAVVAQFPVTFNIPNGVLRLIGSSGITINNTTAGINISVSETSIFKDLAPKLGGILDINGKIFKNSNYNMFEFITGATNVFGFKFKAESNATISVSRSAGLNSFADLILESYGIESYVKIQNNKLSNNIGNFVFNSNSGVFELIGSAKTKLYTQNSLDIQSNSGNINYIFGVDNSNLRFVKQSSQIQIYTDSNVPNDIMFAAGWNTVTQSSSRSIIFKSNILLDNNSSISTVSGNMKFARGIQINDTSSLNTYSDIITKQVLGNLNTVINIIDTNNTGLQRQTNIYELYINDFANAYVSMSVRVKVIGFGTSDMRVVMETPQYSTIANNNNDLIKSLTFSSSFVSGGYNLLLNTISAGKQYAVKFTRLSF